MQKLKMAVSVLAMAMAGCTNQATPYTIDHFFPILAGCTSPDDPTKVLSAGGVLDIASGSPSFVIGVYLANLNLSPGPNPLVLRTGEVVEPGSRNRPLFTQLKVTATASRSLGKAFTDLKPYVQNVNISFNTQGAAWGPFNIFDPALGEVLASTLTPSDTLETDSYVDLKLSVEFLGRLANSDTPISTGVSVYPLRVMFSKAPTCMGTVTTYQLYPPFADKAGNVSADVCAYRGAQSYDIGTPPKAACCNKAGDPVATGC